MVVVVVVVVIFDDGVLVIAIVVLAVAVNKPYINIYIISLYVPPNFKQLKDYD